MRHHFKLTGLLLLRLFAPVALLAYDDDLSGVSDVYEDLHGRTLPAAEDADFDGYWNYVESLFGSDPLDAASPRKFRFFCIWRQCVDDCAKSSGAALSSRIKSVAK